MKTIRGGKMEKQALNTRSLKIMLARTAVILLGLGAFSSGPAMAEILFMEEQLTSDPASQENPDISGDLIVYQDNRNGNWDIYLMKYGYPENRITTNTGNQTSPRISGNKIVYQDDRNGNWDIYLYDLTTKTETQITTSAASQEFPAIDGTKIVWQDNRNGNWDIYLYDLVANTETRVTTSGANTSPAISGNRIAYIKDGNVYYVDLVGGSETKIWQYSCDPDLGCQKGSRNPQLPAISGSHIVWDVLNSYRWSPPNDFMWGNDRDVYMKDVATGATWNTTAPVYWTDHVPHQSPHISELYSGVYYIVYQGWTYDTYHWNIYLYNTLYPAEFRVTNVVGDQQFPRSSGGRIVYMDSRNGNWDIYMTTVGYGAGNPPPPTPAAAIQQIQIIQSIVADPVRVATSDMDGANTKVEENRRKALLNKFDAVIASIKAAEESTKPARRTAEYQSALDQLNSILDKTDGCALRGTPDTQGSGFTPDWIITCPSQALIDPLIGNSITTLEALIK